MEGKIADGERASCTTKTVIVENGLTPDDPFIRVCLLDEGR